MLEAAFAQIANGFSAAFGGPFHDALLHYAGTPELDAGGSITSPGMPSAVNCRVQVDMATEAMRRDADFLERDVRLLIIGPALLTTEPDVEVMAGPFTGQRYSLRAVGRDPAGIGWECRARAI